MWPDGRTDGQMDGRTWWFQYTPPNFVAGVGGGGGGGVIMKMYESFRRATFLVQKFARKHKLVIHFNTCFISSFDKICWTACFGEEIALKFNKAGDYTEAFLSLLKTWFCPSTFTLLREMSMRCVSRYFASSNVHVLTRLIHIYTISFIL